MPISRQMSPCHRLKIRQCPRLAHSQLQVSPQIASRIRTPIDSPIGDPSGLVLSPRPEIAEMTRGLVCWSTESVCCRVEMAGAAAAPPPTGATSKSKQRKRGNGRFIRTTLYARVGLIGSSGNLNEKSSRTTEPLDRSRWKLRLRARRRIIRRASYFRAGRSGSGSDDGGGGRLTGNRHLNPLLVCLRLINGLYRLVR